MRGYLNAILDSKCVSSCNELDKVTNAVMLKRLQMAPRYSASVRVCPRSAIKENFKEVLHSLPNYFKILYSYKTIKIILTSSIFEASLLLYR